MFASYHYTGSDLPTIRELFPRIGRSLDPFYGKPVNQELRASNEHSVTCWADICRSFPNTSAELINLSEKYRLPASSKPQAGQDAVTLATGFGGLLKSQPAIPPKTMLKPKVSRKCV